MRTSLRHVNPRAQAFHPPIRDVHPPSRIHQSNHDPPAIRFTSYPKRTYSDALGVNLRRNKAYSRSQSPGLYALIHPIAWKVDSPQLGSRAFSKLPLYGDAPSTGLLLSCPGWLTGGFNPARKWRGIMFTVELRGRANRRATFRT
jgi:hypothetical protein